MTLEPTWLPVYLLALAGIAGGIRALYFYVRWLPRLPLWQRVGLIAANLAPLLGFYYHSDHDSPATIFMLLGIFFGVSNGIVFICCSIIHTLIFLQEAGNCFLKLPCWLRCLSIGVPLDMLLFWIARV